MKFRWSEVIFAVVFGLALPGILAGLWENNETEELQVYSQPVDIVTQDEVETITVLLGDETLQKVELDSYLTAVILREMPAGFEAEALKAQAVVARTYTLKHKGGSRHFPADICTDSGCCQGYYSQEAYLNDGGKLENIDKIVNAVKETENEVLTYDGELIDATYFSCSGGRTEAAVAVWGSDVPYLQSCESPGEEVAKHYTDTVTFTKKAFAKALELPDSKNITIDYIKYTEGGGIDIISLNGKTIKGTVLRKKLDLNSTAVILSVVGDTVSITTKGNGHRVGMSQYGANAMAQTGANYREILMHYYQGVELVSTLTFWGN